MPQKDRITTNQAKALVSLVVNNVQKERAKKLNKAADDFDQFLTKHGAECQVVKNPKIEAYGVKGIDSTQWRKSFKDAAALNRWLEENDASCFGTRDLE